MIFGKIGNDCSTGGFFADFFTVLSTSIEAKRNNLIPYVELTQTRFSAVPYFAGIKLDENGANKIRGIENNTAFCGTVPVAEPEVKMDDENTWNWWFEQQIPSSADEVLDFNIFLNSFNQSNHFWNGGIVDEVKVAKSFFNDFFKIRKHIKDNVDSYYNLNFKNKKILGVMARLNEMNKFHSMYGTHTKFNYLEHTKDILNKFTDIDSIFLVTEDNDCVELFKENFDNLLYLDVFRRTTQPIEYCENSSTWYYENPPRDLHGKLLGDECLTQALLLGMCDYLICKHCGTSSAGILFSVNIKDVFYI